MGKMDPSYQSEISPTPKFKHEEDHSQNEPEQAVAKENLKLCKSRPMDDENGSPTSSDSTTGNNYSISKRNQIVKVLSGATSVFSKSGGLASFADVLEVLDSKEVSAMRQGLADQRQSEYSPGACEQEITRACIFGNKKNDYVNLIKRYR